MPRVDKYSIIIDLPRIISDQKNQLFIALNDLIKNLVEMYSRDCRIFVTLEPFTSLVKTSSRSIEVYRIAFGPGSIVAQCDNRDLVSPDNFCDLCREFIYLSQEDLWIRTKTFVPCVETNDDLFKEILSNLGLDTSQINRKCKCSSIIKTSNVNREMLRELSSQPELSKPVVMYHKPPESSRENIKTICLKSSFISNNLLALLIRRIETTCYLTSVPGDALIDSSPILVNCDNNKPVIYEISYDTILSTCYPSEREDPLTLLTILYTLFKKQEFAEFCS